LWVAISAASPVARVISISVPITPSAVVWSRLPVGSSASRIFGSLAKRAHDRDALLLAARQPRRAVAEPLAETDPAQQLRRLHARRAARDAGDHLRDHHVFERREFGQQMVELVDEAERRAAQYSAPLIGKTAAFLAGDPHLAGSGPLQEPSQVQQRRFARPRRTDQRDQLAGPQFQIDAVEHRQLDTALAKHPAHTNQCQRRPQLRPQLPWAHS
jgi:hypothetical protein